MQDILAKFDLLHLQSCHIKENQCSNYKRFRGGQDPIFSFIIIPSYLYNHLEVSYKFVFTAGRNLQNVRLKLKY